MKFFTKVTNSMSTEKKWLFTVVLVIVSPFTIWLSLFTIPYVWGYRFNTSKNKAKASKIAKVTSVETRDISSKDKSRQIWYKKPLSIIFSAAIILVFTIGGRLIGSESVSFITSNHATMSEYVSTEHNFKAKFKGTPEIERQDNETQGYKLNLTTYGYSDGNNKYFAIGVIDYPSGFDMSDSRARLEGGLNGQKDGLDSSTILSSSFSKVGSYDAIDGVIEGTKSGVNAKMYTRNILVGQRLYQIISVGTADEISESDFNEFRNSFKLQ